MERLRALARFLMSGKTFTESFFFGGFNFNPGNKYPPKDERGNVCFGQCGCALTQYVGINSNWKLNKKGLPVRGDEHSTFRSAEIEFGLTEEQVLHLFQPGHQKTKLYGG